MHFAEVISCPFAVRDVVVINVTTTTLYLFRLERIFPWQKDNEEAGGGR